MTTEHEMAHLPAAALDATVHRELCDTLGGRHDMVASLYERFLEHASGYIGALRNQAADTHTMTLHTLRGSAAMMGAIRLCALATRLHETSSRCATSTDESAIQQLEQELTAFRRALAAHTDSAE